MFLTIALAGLLCSAALADVDLLAPRRPWIDMVQMTPSIIALEPTVGPAGSQVMIRGTNLAGATRVLFHPDREASFTVVNDTVVQATVPDGAQTGPVQVETPTGMVKSRGPFSVAPN
jgi:hypothetical protein